MAGKPIDYGETFTIDGKTYVQIKDKRHCGICAFWDSVCKAPDEVPACVYEPIAFIELTIK